LIKKGTKSAFAALLNCESTTLGKILRMGDQNTSVETIIENCITFNSKGCTIWKTHKYHDDMFTRIITLEIRIKYLSSQIENTYAQSQISPIEKEAVEENKHGDLNDEKQRIRVGDPWNAKYHKYESENYFCEIHIYPSVFVDSCYCQPISARWSLTAEKALRYIILHELGHFEMQINQNTSLLKPYQFKPLRGSESNIEKQADMFASSVIDCSKKGGKVKTHLSHNKNIFGVIDFEMLFSKPLIYEKNPSPIKGEIIYGDDFDYKHRTRKEILPVDRIFVLPNEIKEKRDILRISLF